MVDPKQYIENRKSKEFCDDLLTSLRNFRDALDNLSNREGMSYVGGEIAQFADEENYQHLGSISPVATTRNGGIRSAIETVRLYCSQQLKENY